MAVERRLNRDRHWKRQSDDGPGNPTSGAAGTSSTPTTMAPVAGNPAVTVTTGNGNGGNR
jgi:hypothetical protein